MMGTPYLWSEGQMAVGEKGKQLAELAPCTFAACDRSQLAASSCREHVPKIAKLCDNFKLFIRQSKSYEAIAQTSPTWCKRQYSVLDKGLSHWALSNWRVKAHQKFLSTLESPKVLCLALYCFFFFFFLVLHLFHISIIYNFNTQYYTV